MQHNPLVGLKFDDRDLDQGSRSKPSTNGVRRTHTGLVAAILSHREDACAPLGERTDVGGVAENLRSGLVYDHRVGHGRHANNDRTTAYPRVLAKGGAS